MELLLPLCAVRIQIPVARAATALYIWSMMIIDVTNSGTCMHDHARCCCALCLQHPSAKPHLTTASIYYLTQQLQWHQLGCLHFLSEGYIGDGYAKHHLQCASSTGWRGWDQAVHYVICCRLAQLGVVQGWRMRPASQAARHSLQRCVAYVKKCQMCPCHCRTREPSSGSHRRAHT
jgi:hypothetical protein